MSQADNYETHFTYFFRVSPEEMNLAAPGNLDYPTHHALLNLLSSFPILLSLVHIYLFPWLTFHSKLYAVQTLVSGFALKKVGMNLI